MQLRPILLTALSLLSTACTTNEPSPRQDTPLTANWRFLRQDPPNAQSPNFNDSNWQPVNLPHTWNALDGQDGKDDYFRGPCWYRRVLSTGTTEPTKQYFLRFEAASLVADVYLNGQFAAHHVGGFAAFCLDITPLIHPGDNLLAVRVDNSPTSDVPPLSGDFTICGGLYRNVHLLTLNKIHISPLDDASPGVYLQPLNITPDLATVTARTLLQNDSSSDSAITLRCTITDAAHHQISSTQTPEQIPAHASEDLSQTLTIPTPHLWNGLADPYLYQATVDVIQNGTVLDRVIQPLGLRTFRVDAQKGFFLNNNPYPLHGVDVHQDFFNKGWAVSPADIDQSYALIEEIGANTVRLAHYQHPDYEYSLCDRAGIVVWAEACLVNRISDTPAFSAACKEQVRELIKQNFNHPSICFWSLFNELGPHTRTDWTLIHNLNDIAHDLDPTRLTVAASHLPAEIPLNGYTDIIGFNRYFGWYTGKISDWPTELDKLHATLPDRSIGISEYGAGASIIQHEQPTTQPSAKGHWHPEDWQAQVHETAWRAIQQRPWLWGTFIWCMFDFASDARNEGDTPGRNDKGLVTADRQTKKDAFYFYKANWSQKPFVHITDPRYTPHPPGLADLKVYSNCESVNLYLNGQFLGTRSSSDHIFLWNQVPLPTGKCDLIARARKNAQQFTDECLWIIHP